MSGGITQLINKGGVDVYLTGNPEITFFKSIYRKHTNFSMEEIEVNFKNSLTIGSKEKCLIPRNGDLVGNCILEFDVRLQGDTNSFYPAEQAISSVELIIGNQLIDKYDSWWMRLWSEINLGSTLKNTYRVMTNLKVPATTATGYGQPMGLDPSSNDTTLQLPLLFSFCLNINQYLPLCNLMYDNISIDVETVAAGTRDENVATISNAKIWCNFIYLDDHERKKFMTSSLDYTINQTQCIRYPLEVYPTKIGKYVIDISNFNNPIKYLAWTLTTGNFGLGNQHYGATGNLLAGSAADNTFVASNSVSLIFGHNTSTTGQTMDCLYNWQDSGVVGSRPEYSAKQNLPFSEVELKLDKRNRFPTKRGGSFVLPQGYYYSHTNPQPGMYMYSFSLEPRENTLSGTCNFSKFDHCSLILTVGCDIINFDGGSIPVYAVSKNILRITEGRCSLLYPTDLGY